MDVLIKRMFSLLSSLKLRVVVLWKIGCLGTKTNATRWRIKDERRWEGSGNVRGAKAPEL